MSTPIKETPVLRGEDAKRFGRLVAANLKKRHSGEYRRAKVSAQRFAQRVGESRIEVKEAVWPLLIDAEDAPWFVAWHKQLFGKYPKLYTQDGKPIRLAKRRSK